MACGSSNVIEVSGFDKVCAARVLENRRMTLGFCSFAKQPLI